MHIPQSWQTFTELEQICLVPQNLISPGTSKPSIDVTQDTLIGAYLLTIQDVKLRKDQVQNLMMFMKKFNGQLPEPSGYEYDQPYWSGKQLYSMILPDININQLKTIKIIRGQITEGYLNGDSLGASPAGLIKQIYNAYGTEAAADFLNNTQKLITRWMTDNSFTISFGDSCITSDQRLKIKEMTNIYINETYDLIKKAQQGVFATDLDESYIYSKLDFEITKVLSDLSEKVKTFIFENISKKNGYYIAGSKGAGSKGSAEHTTQTLGIVGQQSIWGSRIDEGFTERTLPHFGRNDMGPDAKGFCRNSYIEGLTPSETFFHAMGGRTGTIDTAIKSVTGDTPIIIMENGVVKHVNIGEWIDNLLDKNKNNVKNLPEKEMELLELNYEAHIPTTDLDGNVSWGLIKNITRHDPGKELYEIKTHGGRSVIVTESHSLLIWNGTQFERKSTPDVKIGDFVPVTAQLKEPHIINDKIKLSDFLPKTEYLYGSEYHKAFNMVNEVMKNRKVMPEGWWNNNNGKEFILPYNKVQLFMRTIKRENNKDIKEGIIYSYKKRNYSEIKDEFELNNENGILLGLYIAEGNSDIDSGYVQITNSDDNILEFCRNWFEKNNIKYSFSTKKNKIGGTSKCIRGFSTIIGKLFREFVGHGARNKFINPIFFNAPINFIKGLINGIFSGDGTVTQNNVQLGSSSNRLIHDINVCLSRLGIFGKVTITRMKSNNLGTLNMADINLLSIRSCWASIFQKEIELISYDKNEKLKVMRCTETHRNFTQINDTVLDPIIEINKVDISLYPKVYDLTIPSTLNFGLANGLHVVDTADSGYLSRKFIKAAEDLMIHYDMSVRNSSGYIVQFGYGDDNLDPVKIEKISRIELFEYDNKKMEEQYKFDSLDDTKYFESFMTPEAVKEMMDDMEYKVLLNDEYNEMVNMRSELRNNFFKNVEAIGDVGTYVPINLYRIIPSQMIKFNIEPFSLSDLTPRYIITTYNETMKEIVKYLPEKEENWKLFKIIFKSFLATKKVMKEYRLNKASFDSTIVLIKEKMLGALINPGEMVGIIGSQTLGEISTQLTLNTFHLAGVSTGSLVITQGIPRLREIINVSKNLKSRNMKIYLKEQYSSNKNEARKVQSKFGYTQLKDILARSEILYDNKYGDTDKSEDREFIKSYKEFTELFDIDNIDETCLSPWILRLTFDKESLMNRKITVHEVQEIIKQNFHNDQEIECIFSDDSVNDVVMRIRIKQEGKGNFLDFIKEFEKQLTGLSLRGIQHIKQVEVTESNIVKYNNEGAIEPKKEWILTTEGSNIVDVMSDDAVDITRTMTNDILEFYEVFGIEATRELIYRELYAVYAEKHPNPRHIQLMADIMTYRGHKIMQIDRHGLNKNSEIGPIAKACFEEVMNIFTKASLFAEKDNMKGVSANILAGQFCKSGTNAFELLLDEDKLMEHIDIPDFEDDEFIDIHEKDVDKAFDNAFKSYEKTEDVNDKDFNFGFGMEQEKEHLLDENIDIKNTNIILVEKNNVMITNNKEESSQTMFNDINIEPVQEYEKEEKTKANKEINKNTNIIDFDEIQIEEPEYDKTEEKIETKPKKIRVKKTKENEIKEETIMEESKPKKIKVVKKK